jgi:hypothetical protein
MVYKDKRGEECVEKSMVNIVCGERSPNKLVRSKRHIRSQCVYFAFKTIVLFGVLFLKKHVFFKRNFQMKCFETFYILYL